MKQQESDRDVGADFINGDILYKWYCSRNGLLYPKPNTVLSIVK